MCSGKPRGGEGDEGSAHSDEQDMQWVPKVRDSIMQYIFLTVLALLWLSKVSCTGKGCAEFPTRESQESFPKQNEPCSVISHSHGGITQATRETKALPKNSSLSAGK